MTRAAALLVPALSAGLLVAGCGSATSLGATTAPKTAPTSAALAMPCSSGHVAVTVGRVLDVRGCAAGVTAKAGSAALAAVGTDQFRAVRTGATSIVLSARPACTAGTLCPQYVRLVGVISVTVA